MSFLSKVIEKVIASRIISHIENNAIIDKFQSAYKCGHSTETALLRVYSDIVTTIGKGNGSFLVLLDLSAAFDTIDHSNLFDILETQQTMANRFASESDPLNLLSCSNFQPKISSVYVMKVYPSSDT